MDVSTNTYILNSAHLNNSNHTNNTHNFLAVFSASYPLLSFGNPADASPIIHLDDVHCSGTEVALTECSHRGLGVHNCQEGSDEAGVICTSKNRTN